MEAAQPLAQTTRDLAGDLAGDSAALTSPSPLHEILAPQSIAVIGASADPTKRGYKAMLGLIRDGYPGAIYPINPKLDTLFGIKTYLTLSEVPGPIDLALICTPAATLPAVIAECGCLRVKGAVVLAGGFRETGPAGAQLEQEMLAAARAGGVRLIGPNTSGVFNLHRNLNLLALANVRPGGIGLISQSGNMLLALALEAEYNGQVGFSTYVGPGNQTDLGFSDYLHYLGEDPHTQVATLYVEGFRDGVRFLQVARAVSRVKPVVVYKSGSTEVGKRAARSHTGALAGRYSLTVDVLRQAGVSVVSHSDEILPVAEGLGLMRQARGRRVAIIADGGGQATIAADRLSEAGLELAELTPTTQQRLAAILWPQASLANPVDVAGSTDANPALLADCLAIVADDDQVDALLLVGMFGGYGLRFAEHLLSSEMRGAESMIELARRTDKPLVIYSLYAPVKPPPLRRLREAHLPVYGSIEQAVTVLAALSERGLDLQQSASQALPAVLPPLPAMRAMLDRAKAQGRDLFEFEAKALLRAHGVPITADGVVRSPEELTALAAQWGDQPLAMKIISQDILHKSDAGGVKLNLRGASALREAWTAILSAAQAYAPQAVLEGVLVTPMAPPGIEVIIGVVRDPSFGPVLMFGLGGIYVEVFKDVAFRTIPLARYQAEAMVAQIKGSRVLDGVRGEPAVDKPALVDLLVTVAGLAATYPELTELDLNPVRLYPEGYAVVDARVLLNPTAVPTPEDRS